MSNGIATTNITAYLNIRSGKNITSVYAGSSTYESSRSNTATAEISLRKAQIVVTTNTTKVKQDQYIKFTATLYDITTWKLTTMTQDSSQYVYFKVNDITLKNKNGTPIQVKIVNGIATYSYKVPLGLSGVTDGKTMTPKNHTVKAGYYNPNYYPDVTNTTKFQVERLDITINITQSTINKTSHKINIIKQFIKESLDNKPLIAITTDLYPMYRNIFDDLNIKQQLCIIHLRRTIYTKLKRYTRRNKFTDEEIEKNIQKCKRIYRNIPWKKL